jgi:uncharacterized protein YecT (DUF1311 family)
MRVRLIAFTLIRQFALAAGFVWTTGSSIATELCKMDGSQLEMNQCALQRHKASDAELNAIYSALMSATSDETSKATNQAIRAAQRAWIGFRDSTCDVYKASFEGGSIMPMLHSLCLERLTKDQSEILKTFCEDGAVACE